MIRPWFRVDRIGYDAWGRHLFGGRREQAALAERSWERVIVPRVGVRHKTVNRPGRMIQHVKVPVAVFAKPDDSERGVCKFPVVRDSPVLITKAPKLARVVVSVDVMSLKILQTLAVIRQPVGDGRRFRVWMVDRWW